jgi:hypothetical protein
MMARLSALLEVYRRGRAVANPAAWSKAAIVGDVAALLTALSALAQAFGWIDSPLTTEQALTIAAGVAAVAGLFSGNAHVVASERVGLAQKREIASDEPPRAARNKRGTAPDPVVRMPPGACQPARLAVQADAGPRPHPGDEVGFDHFNRRS